MKSSTRLDYADFQLTPTRTRYDLMISANGESEKIASGLLVPFIDHLKTAKDEIAKGGYSIRLKPGPGVDAAWFTKGTVERFVRFVRTPEVLERVYTLESEILQIEEAIAIQRNSNLRLNVLEDGQAKSVERIDAAAEKGRKLIPNSNEEKAIVLYNPGACLPEANGSTGSEGDSKVQLLKVLEIRKTVLRKEQGMAFACAVAAGFDIDNMALLVSFSKCFGARRLMEACLRFMNLWKAKHETGQWLEIEASETMSNHSDFSSVNTSGIMLSNATGKQKIFAEAFHEYHGEVVSENNGASADQKSFMDHQVPIGGQEHFQCQFPHHSYPSWPACSTPGALPVFQTYPMQGIPYYQNYLGTGQGSIQFQPPHPAVDYSTSSAGQTMGHKRHSVDSMHNKDESETWDINTSRSDQLDDIELEKEDLHSQELQKKAIRRRKKKSGVVVIRNINYIASKKQISSGSQSESTSDSEVGEESGDFPADALDKKHKNSSAPTKIRGNCIKSIDALNSSDKDAICTKEGESGHWLAFENCLLKDVNENEQLKDRDMFAMEKDGQVITHMVKISNDELLVSGREGDSDDRVHQGDIEFNEINGKMVGPWRSGNEDLMIHGHENQSDFGRSSDPLSINGFEHSSKIFGGRSLEVSTDESFVIPLRSASQVPFENECRNAIDMNFELPSALQKAENNLNDDGRQANHEPADLSLMPERGEEKGLPAFDPALELDYELQVSGNAPIDTRKKEVMKDVKHEQKKSDKDRKPKVAHSTDKRTITAARRGNSSKLSHLDDARARADRLRSFKMDLQRMKKEKEEEQIKRLEALKSERQKRIAARISSTPAKSPVTMQQTRKRLSTKLSPKFTDSDPSLPSHIQRFPTRTGSLGSKDSQKAFNPRSSNANHLTTNKLSKSASSLSESKKENAGIAPEPKASMAGIRRLSEPKLRSSHPVPSIKARNREPVSKPKISLGHGGKKVPGVELKTEVSGGPESKKIHAIVSLDRTKAAALPELKMKPTDVLSKLTVKDVASVISEGADLKKTNLEGLQSNRDGKNPMTEKTVVMFECQKDSIPLAHASQVLMIEKNVKNGGYKGERSEVQECETIPTPPSTITANESDIKPIICQVDQSNSLEVTQCVGEKEPPYAAPYARVSSWEDPCDENSECGKAISTGVSRVGNLLEKIPETSEKTPVKGSSKGGIRRLLKIGKRSGSSAGERNAESDGASVNDSEADDSAASTEVVKTLKTLISQDETPTAESTPQKASRHFSLLSPFRSRSNEKKLII